MEIMVPLCLVRKADAGETIVPQHYFYTDVLGGKIESVGHITWKN